ncbi:MAG: carbohydrate ABC transporter permease [Epulopiscium sp.]|nr:carbohydrate ABC transporter permease [Candidatus Epulonipiscium sp.]
MIHKADWKRKIFILCNTLFLTLVTLISIFPIVHLLAVSLSSNVAANAGVVKMIPVGFTLEAYKFLMEKSDFLIAFGISLKRVALGTTINMVMVILTAYPLSKEKSAFKARTFYVWFFAFTMFFGGGLVPAYIVIQRTGLMNTLWALVIPGALNVWNMVMLLNFFRGIPKELEEAAIVDGANHFTILWKIYLPVSKPALATILLFTIVGHWNAWFDGMIYMNSPASYPLQTYLYTLVTQNFNKKLLTMDDIERLKNVSEKTLQIAQIFLGALPIMLVYPFLQKYFIKGIVVGSVKE